MLVDLTLIYIDLFIKIISISNERKAALQFEAKVWSIIDAIRRLSVFCDTDSWVSAWRIYYRQLLGSVHKQRDRSCFLSFSFFSFLPFYRLCNTSFGLPGVPCRFRAQIFADTPLNVQRRSGGETPSRNLGSPQICPRQIFAYWYAGSAFAPRVFLPRPSFVFYRRLLRLLRVGFLRVWYRCFPVAIILSNDFLRKGTRMKSTLFMKVEYIKYE